MLIFRYQDLKDHFRQVGEVSYADAHKMRRNEGCVEFANRSDMKRAIEKLDGTELNGRQGNQKKMIMKLCPI